MLPPAVYPLAGFFYPQAMICRPTIFVIELKQFIFTAFIY
ncbi:hypothetical protein CSC17_3776 [Klebsiella oxytoca]|nr:hypothetical protein CSC17_3776 [Klebsiella oxytoca]